MVLYEIYWIRYFRSAKTMKDLYSSILGIPVAGATLPVLAFMLLAVYGAFFFILDCFFISAPFPWLQQSCGYSPN